MARIWVTCDCAGTQTIDADRLGAATGETVRPPCSALCTDQIGIAAKALEQGDAVICCAQERRAFEDLAEEIGAPAPATVDLRDRAGWGDGADATPKMAALMAEALLPAPVEKTIDVESEGLCLILGAPEVALSAAEALKDHLGVTVLLDAPSEIPESRDFDVVAGRLHGATGALGRFEVRIDALRQVIPGGRGALGWSNPRDGGRSECDVILDLTGGTPLFPAHEKRDGYLRADPARPEAVAAAVLAASHMTGTFEKTLHVRTEPLLCAHARAEQTGCTRCLDLCPTGAILPAGDHVTIDPHICAGCGVCSAVCPSGAVSFDAPPVDHTMLRVQTLARSCLAAGGTAPRLLVHDAHGAEMIRLAARHFKGLPADVIPLDMVSLGAFGHAEAVAAVAAGFASVDWLPGPAVDLDALTAQAELAAAIAGADRVRVISTTDPEALCDDLRHGAPDPVKEPVRPLGSRRQITRQGARALHPEDTVLPLPEGAPYGAVLVDTDACTLCLSCAALCPSGALGDNPDRPELRFQEDACLQCGLCATICPENAITLEPRLDLSQAALGQRVLHAEEPFACIECGAEFGVRSTIERITEKLSSHGAFQGERLRMIQMCDTCRVSAEILSRDDPDKLGERPKPRTTADYLSKRRDH
ncbi:4Fe-4S binding protein [Palleronia caenipelagi]|uniref:4Fe-4S dicluster domain-containing protein n=1 Tax=Palleronia caenipelagi TaxID=2489174 RepID=A0A547Q9F1_9RHOB|nr:4Fe-4S binding protein [Palleronia caenipelagi]TRD23013.1 4Fe-4S dicluster domain-containing protein [Palleronia caenipelagi]